MEQYEYMDWDLPLGTHAIMASTTWASFSVVTHWSCGHYLFWKCDMSTDDFEGKSGCVWSFQGCYDFDD